MNKKKLVSLIMTICMVMLLTPSMAHASEVQIGEGGAPVKVTTVDHSVDKSSVRVDGKLVFRNSENGEEVGPFDTDIVIWKSATVDTFDTVKESAIAEAKTKLNKYFQVFCEANPDLQATIFGDMVVAGNKVSHDNRTYTMKLDESGSGGGTTSRYMLIEGDYGYEGEYSVTMTIELELTENLPVYKFLEGTNGKWTQNSSEPLTFRADGDFSKFTGVKVDDTLIDAKNYTAVSGSTIVTLKADYLKTLSVGTHTLTVVFNDGICSTNFEIEAAQIVTPASPEPEKAPKTGDESNPALWFTLLCVVCAGAAGTTIYSRKKKYSVK